MSKHTQSNRKNTENPWITPTVIVAVIGLIGTLATLYFGYLQSIRPLELAATQTVEARRNDPTATLPVPTFTPQSLPTTTATLISSTATPKPELTRTPVPSPATLAPSPTPTPAGLKFCINPRSIYVRSGPGTEFGPMGSLTFEDCLYFDGQNPEQNTDQDLTINWLRISPNQSQYLNLGGGWVRGDLVRPQDFVLLPIIYPPTATPTPEG